MTRYAFDASMGSDHAVRLKVHRRMRLDMVPLVDGTGKIDRVVLVPVNTEDLLGSRLDLADIVHQLPPVGMP